MGYRSDVAVQFINQAEADKFIDAYNKELEERKPTYCNLFNMVDEKVVNKFGEVIYHWKQLKFYGSYPEIGIFQNLILSEEYVCLFIEIGEEYDDFMYDGLHNRRYFNQPIYPKREIVITY